MPRRGCERRGGRRHEVENEEEEAEHSFSLQRQVAARAPLPVQKGVPSPECPLLQAWGQACTSTTQSAERNQEWIGSQSRP